MSKAIKDGVLQSNIDGQGLYTIINGGGVAPGGSLLSANNLSDVESASTSRTNLGLTDTATTSSTAMGKNILGVGNGTINYLLQTNGAGNSSWRSPAGVRVDISAQISHANLTALSSASTPTTAGMNILAMANNSSGEDRYIKISSTNVPSLVSATALSTVLLNGLTINPSTGSLAADGMISVSGGDLTVSGATVFIQGNVYVSPSFTVAGSSSITITSVAGSDVTLPLTGTLATLDGAETLTGKTITAPTITGGTHSAITTLGIRSTGGVSHNDLRIATDDPLTANRTLTVRPIDGNRALTLSGDVYFGGEVSTDGNVVFSGAHDTTIVVGADTTIVLPATGTVATLAGSETLSSKTISAPTVTGGLGIRSSGAAYNLTLASSEAITGNKTLSLTVNNADRSISLSGNVVFGGSFTTVGTFAASGNINFSGAYSVTLTATATTTLTLPTTGTLVAKVGAPASASATGIAGQTSYDSSYFYICTATDTWRRIAHNTW